MYEIKDLFDMQSVVGARLEEILSERGYTKVELCQMSGISRPTLDKLLAGTITSRTNYEKHITKVLQSLNMSPDMLLGNTQTNRCRVRSLRNMMHINEKDLAEFVGVSVDRIKAIEAGGEAEMAELRDIAVVLHTSVASVLEKNIFPPQIELWGHIGVRPMSSDIFFWYPITNDTRKMIYQTIEEKYLTVPCMNNKILLINMENTAEIVLLDDCCDEPRFGNWDYEVDCGDAPLVFYESLDDYLEYKEAGQIPPENLISKNLCRALDQFTERNHGEDDFEIRGSKIYYPDGKMDERDIDFRANENISDNMLAVFDFGAEAFDESILYCSDVDGAEIFLNRNSFSFIEGPLLEIENVLYETQDDL